MIEVYTVAQVRAAEERCDKEYGIPLGQLMDNAGRGLAGAVVSERCCSRGTVWVFCGTGNNGGDGYVCATELMRRGVPVVVCAVRPDDLPEGSLVHDAARRYIALGGEVVAATTALTPADVRGVVIVDALLGTGVNRPVTGLYAHLIDVINASGLPVVACDVPSGVDADTGAIQGTAVTATRTIVMGLLKPACAQPPGSARFGQIEVCDIGLPDELVAELA